MAEFIAKLGLDAKEFVSGMEAAAQKAGMIGKAMTDSASDSKKLSDGLKSASAEADGLAKSTKEIDANLQKAGSSGGALDGLTSKFKEGQAAASAGGGMFGEVANKLGQLATPAGAATAAIGVLTAGIAASVTIGQEFQQSLAGVSAVTGLTGPALDDIGNRARELAKRFGGEASTQLSAFQGVLSKFGAQLAQTPEELGKVSENINILAKAGGLDAQQAMDTLANSMLQFGVNVSDGAEAAAESSRYINVLAASARVGAAEIPQVGEAVLVAGVAAKQSKVSFEETNAAIQVLAAGGKVGAEAGVALRNVLGKIAGEDVIPKEALAKLKSLGVDMSVVSNTSLSFSDRMKELSKASGDATAFAQVFGTENAAAASILANGAGTIADWTKEITGTQDATTQAAVNMNTFGEQMNRAQAYVEDLAISLFNAFAPAVTAVIGYVMDFAGVVGTAIGGLWSFVQPLIMPLLEFFNLHLIVAFNLVKSVVTGFVAAAQDAFARFQVVIEPLRQALSGLFGKASEGTSIMDSLKVVFETVAKVAQAVFSVALGVVVKYIEGVVFILTKLVALVKDGISFITGIATAVQDWATNLLKTNETIGFVVGNVQKFIDGIIKLKDQLLSILGIGGQEVKVTAKVETKPEDTKKQVEDGAKKDPPKIAAKATTDKQSEKDRLEDLVKTATANLRAEQLIEENKLKQKAIDENRKLTASEQADILRSQIALTERIAKATSDIYKTSGEGQNLKLGVKLEEKDRVDVRNKVVSDLDKLSEEKVKLQFQIINLNESVRKDSLEYISKTASILKEEGQKRLSLDLFIKDPTSAAEAANAKIAELRKQADNARVLDDKDTADKISRQADDLAEKLAEVSDKAAEKRKKIAEEEAKKAEEQRKKNIELALTAIENEQARALAMKIFKLTEERRAILRSTDGTEADRLAIARRYQNEIDALKSGRDENVEKEQVRLAKEEAALRSSLAARKTSYEQFNSQIAELQKRKAELEKQIADNQAAAEKAIEEARKAAQAAGETEGDTKQPTGTAVSLDTLGLKTLSSEALATLLKIANETNNLKDALSGTIESLNDDLAATFDLMAEESSNALDFENNGLIDNAEQLGNVLSASFASGIAAGDNYKASIEASVTSAQTAIDDALKGRLKAETDAYAEAAKQGTLSYQQVADVALTTFALQVNQGENALTAAKNVAVQTAGTLLETYAIPAIASFLAFLGPFALPVAMAAIGLLRSQLQSLAGGFQEGGYTGDGGPSQIAGVVHGQEFVHTADVTRKHRGLFEHLHKGGELSSWMVTTAGALQAPAVAAPQLNTYGIESRLDRLEMAINRGNRKFESMRAVQMTVEHDPTLTIKAQSRNLEIRSARA